MRRLLIVSILTISTAMLGACTGEVKTPENKPAATATPAATSTPVASPSGSPAASPAKVEDKKDDKGGNTNGVKPTETPKTK